MIDSHAHVAFRQFDDDRAEVIARARAAGVVGWIEIGTDLEQSRRAIALADQHENVWATVGVHPSDVEAMRMTRMDHANDANTSPLTPALSPRGERGNVWREIEELARHPKVKAIGEVGLDLYRGGDLEEQKSVLQQFITLAHIRGLPMVFHIRSGEGIDLHEVLISLLGSYGEADRPRGVMHTFSGNADQARRYVELGMYISFSGVITFKNAEETRAVARAVPRNRILIETDCPFLAPEPYRGQQNEPAYVALVAEKLAEIRGVAVEEIQLQTQNNTEELFRLV